MLDLSDWQRAEVFSALSLAVSVCALVVSAVAALGTIWQARTARSAHKSTTEAEYPLVELGQREWIGLYEGSDCLAFAPYITNRSNDILNLVRIKVPVGYRCAERQRDPGPKWEGKYLPPSNLRRSIAVHCHCGPAFREKGSTAIVWLVLGVNRSWMARLARWSSMSRMEDTSVRIAFTFQKTGKTKQTITSRQTMKLPAKKDAEPTASRI